MITPTEIDELEAGREMDKLVARHVFQATYLDPSAAGILLPWDIQLPDYSTDIRAAWKVVDKLAPLASNFQGADGFFELMRGEWASHEVDGCFADKGRPDEEQWADDDGPDKYVWSAHFHLHDMIEGPQYPGHWKWMDSFCSRADSAPLAICRAALKAAIDPRGSDEGKAK